MTIQDIWKLAREKAPECLMDVPYPSFSRCRVAIDMFGYCYPMMMSARMQIANTWPVADSPVDQDQVNGAFYAKFIQRLLPMLAHDITPVFVFEYGKNPKKKATDDKRTEEREATQERIDSLRAEINGDLFASDNAIKIKKLRQLEGSLKYFPSTVRDELRTFLEILGIPVVACKVGVEAERVASILCMKGIAMAVYSPDGDCLAHGAPLVIRSEGPTLTDEGVGVPSFSVAHLPTLLDSLALTMEQFRDVCICSGCDYNNRIFRVGIARVLQLVRDYGKPRDFPENYDTSCYKYEECIVEFGEAPVEQCVDIDLKEWSELEYLQVRPNNDWSEMPESLANNKSRDVLLRHTYGIEEATNYVHFDLRKQTFAGVTYEIEDHHLPYGAVQSEIKGAK